MGDVKVEYVDIKKLHLLDKNPRKISKHQFTKLCKSLQDDPSFFDCRPCLVNHIVDVNKMVVYAGNQRVAAAKKLGWNQVPCIVENDLFEELMQQRIIKDNQHYGEFDYDLLANEYEVADLLDAGFNESDLVGKLDDVVEIEEKKVKEKPVKVCPHCNGEI